MGHYFLDILYVYALFMFILDFLSSCFKTSGRNIPKINKEMYKIIITAIMYEDYLQGK